MCCRNEVSHETARNVRSTRNMHMNQQKQQPPHAPTHTHTHAHSIHDEYTTKSLSQTQLANPSRWCPPVPDCGDCSCPLRSVSAHSRRTPTAFHALDISTPPPAHRVSTTQRVAVGLRAARRVSGTRCVPATRSLSAAHGVSAGGPGVSTKGDSAGSTLANAARVAWCVASTASADSLRDSTHASCSAY